MHCSYCNSSDIYLDEAAGQFTCTQCGLVLEENTIVSTIEFQETGDRSHVIGRHVSYAAAMSNSGGLYSGGYGSGNSRESTLAKARIKIKAVADSVGNLVSTDIDMVGMAHQYYKLALAKNFLSGRKAEHVAVACLYLVCRKHRTDHLLIDFSDSTQCNVYNLGRVFVQLIQILQEHQLPIIDPSLFIHRYAKKLQLEDKLVKPVMISALRIVTRMKKDWMTTGRRPDGICAAAMLISTRAHGVEKPIDEIARLFRISKETLRFRLKEFSETHVAKLSLEDFRGMSDRAFDALNESWQQMDPPIYRRHQLAAEVAAEAVDGEVASSSSEPATRRAKAFEELYEDIRVELESAPQAEDNELLTDGEGEEDDGVGKAGKRIRAVKSAERPIASDEMDEEDPEIAGALLDHAERSSKVSVWEGEYRGVLDARAALRLVREAEELARGSRLTKRGKRRRGEQSADGEERREGAKDSARGAVENVLLVNSSRKINYEAMTETFREDGSFKTPDEVRLASDRSPTSTAAATALVVLEDEEDEQDEEEEVTEAGVADEIDETEEQYEAVEEEEYDDFEYYE